MNDIEKAIEAQQKLILKCENRVNDLEETIKKHPWGSEGLRYDADDWRGLELKRRKEQIKIALTTISALEKQMPKQVKWTPAYQSYFSAGDEAEPFCPECGELLEDEQSICLDCYQVIDWRVGE